ncbi:MAG: hypothetical protein K2W82_10535 [Candidatus Obscuribacterales bacterium]|nr:hypothetical protein [Candidatus Obscuribacterales bacterium]
MSSQFRTAFAGFGVLAVCLAMASLKWQFLLVGLAFAGIFCGYMNWRQLVGRPEPKEDLFADLDRYERRSRRRRRENVLAFPEGSWSVSDASGI